ncbi:MAG: plasmid partitioning protein RepB [Acidiphilium sp. 21-66-27]|uniref:plasmid partitioning protein RepB n=1 Tax=unclassified Acidiphilium TaxID=2617493 RepID=UPI000BC4B30B|nr:MULTISPECIES: plasmid partitioning protein RepB [unclassified Acidiphilium]OYV54657.1 MAG: plasmid partitioning protein RepB [Acidiphilium sp. 20-67-58]OYV67575.1 MAG: plasmid partitioning protein RepB [Acidiphilium sp. 21-66-27]
MSKKPSRSIVGSFNLLSESLRPDKEPVEPNNPSFSPAPHHTPRMPAGVVAATERSISQLREERDQLRARLSNMAPDELDPAILEPSPIPDRLPDDDQEGFNALVDSISAEGQKLPIQVRPHPSKPGRYQIVYGHRRWRAAQHLGVKVRAFVVALDDRELIITQGLENESRQDLSWIERASFARKMEDRRIDPRDIKGALSIDDAELSKMRMVTRVISRELIETIGRAPKIGRPRWLNLAKALESDPSREADVRQTLSGDKAPASSNERFSLAMATLQAEHLKSSDEIDLLTSKDVRIGTASFSGSSVTIRFSKDHAAPLREFIRSALPELADAYERQVASNRSKNG